MSSSTVVDDLDPGRDSDHRGLPGGEVVTVVELGFQGGPERFLLRVVEAHAGASDRQAQLEALRGPGELGRGVLAAAVGVEDHAAGVAMAEGHGFTHRVLNQVSVQAVAEGVAEHAPRTAVTHRTQVQPALTGRQVGDVGGPDPVELAGVEPALDQVGKLARPAIADRGDRGERSGTDALNVVGDHDLRDGLARDLFPIGAELSQHSGSPVRAVRGCVGSHHFGGQFGTTTGAGSGFGALSGHPGVVARAGDAQQLAHALDGDLVVGVGLLRGNHRECLVGVCA